MTTTDIARLERGKELLADIKKQERQLEALCKCNMVKIFGWDDGKRIDFDLLEENPFYPQAAYFIEQYKTFLTINIQSKQREFDNL